ncbi:GTPase Era [Merdimmobilis hominis]|uniref:GTPase Era n=1 Tax=uncultured Anaerotruncus sp. TaxID=905011 RepID=A0A6N2RE98_9FIRM|nr:GTPase Era [Merdimmobilis hominis]PWL57778.1 MAG: GTPase Era [Oscillospiraceae bacterium]
METRSAFIAIVGRPNVGKSSLLNAMVGEKVAIVSDKPQTTRNRIVGILTRGETQLVFIDTPGMHKPRTKLSEFMVRQVRRSVADVDAAVLVTEPEKEVTKAERELLDNIKAMGIPAVLVINKIDTLKRREDMLEKMQALSAEYEFEAVVPLSALTGDGVDILLAELSQLAEEGPHFFDDDDFTDQPERVIAGEIIREKILNNMREEIPHGTAVSVESMKEREDKDIIDIDAVIYCERDSHKGMLIGKQGSMLKTIGSQAREEIEAFLDAKVNLKLWVKVKEDWRNKEGLIKQFGFTEE